MSNAKGTNDKQPDSDRERPEDLSIDFVSDNPEHRVEIESVYIEDLYVDPMIQRSVQPGEVAKIVAGFNEAALGTITVSVRESTVNGNLSQIFSLVDGQQRVTALKQMKWERPITAVMHYGLSLKEEARLFLDLNFRYAVGSIQQFKTRLTAEDPKAVAIKEILDKLEIPIGVPHGFQAIATADRIYSKVGGPTQLSWALQMVKEIYSDGKNRVFDGRVIEAFAIIYQNFAKQLDDERLVNVINKQAPRISKLVGYGETRQEINGGQIQWNIADAIRFLYNRSKRLNPKFPTALGELPRFRQVAEQPPTRAARTTRPTKAARPAAKATPPATVALPPVNNDPPGDTE